MQDESTALPQRREIYRNLRSPEGHELPGAIAAGVVQRRYVPRF